MRERIGDAQHPRFLPVTALRVDAVFGPDVIAMLRAQTNGRAI